MFICTTCDRIFTEIPEAAIQVSGGYGHRARKPITYRFTDGSFHSLRRLKKPQLPPLEPKEDTELLQKVSVVGELPTPSEPEVKQEVPQVAPVIEEDESSMSAMQFAFRRIQKEKYAAAE